MSRQSARIEARQGNARKGKNTPRPDPGWSTPTTSNVERKLLLALIEHLRETTDDMDIIRYLAKEYWTLAPTMHTAPTLRKVRTQLRELGVEFVQFDNSSLLWKYWNDYTEEGMTAWEQQKQVTNTEQDDVENEEEEETKGEETTDGRKPPQQNDDERAENNQQTGTTPDPPAMKDPPSTGRNREPTTRATTNDEEEAYESSQTTMSQQQSQPLLTQNDAISQSDWFRSPPRIRNPYTGKMIMTPIPPPLKHMMQTLQDHNDWYQEDDTKDGFTTVTGRRSPRNNKEPTATLAGTPTAHRSNRYQVLMEDAMETLTKHAQQLEEEAEMKQQTRMAASQEILDTATETALNKIQEATAELNRHCETQLETLIADLDNFTGQAQQLQQELLNGVRDETNAARTIPIDDEEDDKQDKAHDDEIPNRRWTQVDYNAIQQGQQTVPIPEFNKVHQAKGKSDDKYDDPNYQLPRLRSATTPITLHTRERKAVLKFYNAFADMLLEYRVPIKTFDQISIETLEAPNTTIYPDSLTPESPWFKKYSAAIYARLEEDGVDTKEPIYRGILQLHNQSRDGYSALKSILAATLMVDAKNIGQLSTPPPVTTKTHPFEYASMLQEFYFLQQTFQRHYTEREKSTMFLQGMRQVAPFASAAMQLMHDLDQHALTGQVPHRLLFQNLSLTLASHPAAPVTTPDGTYGNDRTQHRTEYDSTTAAQLNVTWADRTGNTQSSNNSTHRNRRSPPTRSGTRTTTTHKDIQCAACQTYGHEVAACKVLPKVAACMEFIQMETAKANNLLQRHKQANHPSNQRTRQQTRNAVANKLHGRLMDSDIDDLVEEITDSLCWMEDTDDDDVDAQIYSLRTQTEEDETREDAAHGRQAIQPVKLPIPALLKETSLEDGRTTQLTPASVRVSIATIQQRDLADTGASVSATGIREILHNFTTQTRYEITGYDGNVTKAAGEGYAWVQNKETNTTDKILFVYTPAINGTIFSLEHHAQTHPRIHRWTQEAIPSTNGGWITFYDANNEIVSKYPTERVKGVYYIQDLQFVTPAEAGIPAITNPPHQSATIQMVAHMKVQQHQPSDFTNRGDLITLLEGIPTPTNKPTVSTVCHTIGAQSGKQTPGANLLAYEVWHQRMAHCSEAKLKKTQEQVDGIPKFQAPIPTVVRCRACDIATLRKAPRGDTTLTTVTYQPGQTFQMDLGFFRGPGNLIEVYNRTAMALPKIIESRQGFVCYLLVIDKCTRYIWVFPLRSKSVPAELITMFIQTHGNQNPAVLKTVRTDGEGSLAESPEFRTLLARNGYRLEKTATDTSSQNGLAERPHQTLGEMVRCLLYSAAMPTHFWADAIVYAAYIYNRLYHEGAKGVPYNLWTGTRANVKHLRAFGAKVLVKRSGNRQTKADPHYYDGRFLRFSATNKNIIYYDEVTKREKVARHLNMDEFHYDSEYRPPGARQVMEQLGKYALQRTTPPKDACIMAEECTDNTPNAPLDTIDPDMNDTHHRRQPMTATAATLTFEELSEEEKTSEAIMQMHNNTTAHGPPVYVRLPLNRLPTLGLLLTEDPITQKVRLRGCQEGTAANRLKRWRSRIKFADLHTVDGQRIRSIAEVQHLIATARYTSNKRYVDFIFVRPDTRATPDTDIPHLHFDQLRHINHLHAAVRQKEPYRPTDDTCINLTRTQLKKQDDFHKWKQSEWKQLDKYEAQDMFAEPIPRPPDATVLPFVWTYIEKEDPVTTEIIQKARGTCNGGKRYGKAVTMAETYATCVEQPACRLYWSATATEGYIAMGADAGNAFAEAPPPIQPFYMHVDDQYREWWTEHKGRPPIPAGYVLPVQHALQGHPEAPRLWEQHIHDILTNHLHFKCTTHEKCLYVRRDPQTKRLQYLLRQVDDFSVSAKEQTECKDIIESIGKHLKVPLNDLGIIRKFNGVNIQQTKWFVKVSCEDYLRKILEGNGWTELKAAAQPIPMRQDSAYQRQLELTDRPQNEQQQKPIQDQAGFSYRKAIGELIYALVIARPDISFSTTKLSQYSMNPALIHYQAAKAVFAFLNNTREDGLIFWRQTPRDDLPDIPLPTPRSAATNALPQQRMDPAEPIAFSDSDWGSDFSHRRSVSGMIIILSGAAVIYKTFYQKSVSLSSTEAEFISAADAGKMILYIRSILKDMGYEQTKPTTLYVDNTGAVFMVEAQAPTKRTRHVDIRYFALLDWSKTNQLKAIPVRTDANVSDSMTKATGRIKFHQHADIYMGRVPPQYVTDRYPYIQPAYIHALISSRTQPLSSTLGYPPLWLTSISEESMGG